MEAQAKAQVKKNIRPKHVVAAIVIACHIIAGVSYIINQDAAHAGQALMNAFLTAWFIGFIN